MTAVISTIELGVDQLNNWLSALATGESASTVGGTPEEPLLVVSPEQELGDVVSSQWRRL